MSNTLSTTRISDIRERLNIYMKDNPSISNRIIGRNIGYSAGYVSQFRNGKFPAPEKEQIFAERIENYLSNIEEAEQNAVSAGHLKFAMTSAAQDIFYVANYASTEHKIGVVSGVPGGGKTITVEEITKRSPNNILIQVTPIISQRILLQDLASALKVPIYYQGKNNHEVPVPNVVLFREIIKKFEETNRSLICDEGENLTTGCLEIIRRIHDFTGVGVLLSGTKKLLDRLRGPRRELQQLYSRVGICTEIDLLKIGDVRAILQLNFPEGIGFAQNFLQLSKNNGRVLEHLIHLAKREMKDSGEDLTEEVIDLAAQSLLM